MEPVLVSHQLECQFEVAIPTEKGVTDVTYLLFGELTLYLSTIIDASNREIISYIISELQTLTLDLRKLKRAGRGRKAENVIRHSD